MTTPQRRPAQARASAVPQGRYCIGDRGFSFAAAHRLAGVPDGHKARRMHGHTYTVEVELADTELRGPGFVADYAELAPVGEYLKRDLDHRDLSALFTFETTTDQLAQHLAAWFLARMPLELGKQLQAVRMTIGAAPAAPDPVVGAERFTFDAAHHLDGLPPGHKCGRMHGHSYTVDLRLDPSANPGVHTRDLAAFGDYLDQELDYGDLSELLPFQATSELVAEHLHGWVLANAGPRAAAGLRAVRVWESPRRWAEFSSAEASQ